MKKAGEVLKDFVKKDRTFLENIGKKIKGNQYEYDNRMDWEYDHHTIYGGNCFVCKKKWNKMPVVNSFSDYHIFVPTCKCYEKRKKLKKLRQHRKIMYKLADIPAKFIKATMENMNTKMVQKGIIDAIKKIKEYLIQNKYNSKGLILYGHVGTGKSHAGIAVLKYLLVKERWKCKFVPMSDIITNIINNDFDYIQNLTQDYDAVMFDDIDKLNVGRLEHRSEWTAERMFSLFDGMIRNEKKIIATSNCESMEEIAEKFDKAIVSRLMGECELVKFAGQDYRLLKRTK